MNSEIQDSESKVTYSNETLAEDRVTILRNVSTTLAAKLAAIQKKRKKIVQMNKNS